MSILDGIHSPKDLKELKKEQLEELCNEIRAKLISVTTKNGGHLASNLGAVELSVALHYVFDSPKDKILFDVGHQSYTHKLLTGRNIDNIRLAGGISGFPKRSESEYDPFGVGHSSTALSAALGFAEARRIQNLDYNVAAVVGDASLTGGLSFEALNNIGASSQRMLIVLNDNKMSISKNVGALSKYLSRFRLKKGYLRFKRGVKNSLGRIPILSGGLEKCKKLLKAIFVRDKLFEQLGIKYIGPIDGHNLSELIEVFKNSSNENKPVLVHIITQKGRGMLEAEKMPEKYHGIAGADEKSEGKSFSKAVGEKLIELAEHDERVAVVTAAMPDGTGTSEFAQAFPSRFFDVGIAEGHAAVFCAALAAAGLRPFFAVYSSFLQRSYDQLVHDVALQKLPVCFLVDRAGIVGADGATHQGVFDHSFLRHIPNLNILCPKDTNELKAMMEFALTTNLPSVIRYPKSCQLLYSDCEPIELAKWEVLTKNQPNSSKTIILATSVRPVEAALEAVKMLDEPLDVCVVNARFVKPLDTALLDEISKEALIITVEENVLMGGFGSGVLEHYAKRGKMPEIKCVGLADEFIPQGDILSQLSERGLDAPSLARIIRKNQ